MYDWLARSIPIAWSRSDTDMRGILSIPDTIATELQEIKAAIHQMKHEIVTPNTVAPVE